MDILNYQEVETQEEIKELYTFANKIWHEYFPCILEKEQIDYMVEMFFSPNVVEKSIKDGYEFYFAKSKDETIGFIAIHPEKDKLFLSKLYLSLENRGKGYASHMLNFVKNRGKELNLNTIYLTVNKYNSHTIDVYKHHGFKTIRSEETDIGRGYIMDDYVMELNLK